MTEQRRDLAADLQICEAATPGPWEVEGAGGVHVNGTRDGYIVVRAGTALHTRWMSWADAMFVANARQGWPHAIRRALAAEAEVERLLRLVEQLETLLSVINGLANSGLSTSGVERRSLGRIRNHAKGALDRIHEAWYEEDRQIEEAGQHG